MSRLLTAPLAAVLFLLLPATAAQAHAYVVATTPANGAELAKAPATVRVTFDEPVTLASAANSANVIDADGHRVDAGPARLESGRRTLVIGVRPGLPRGAYIASWSVVSADTHPIGGSIQFGYGVAAAPIATQAANRPSAGWELAAGGSKSLVYLGLVGALGLIPAALLLGAGERERQLLWRTARIGAVVTAAASVAQVLVQYYWQSGGELTEFAGSSYARAVYGRLGLLVTAAFVLPSTARPAARLRWTATGLLALAILGTVVHNGHGGGGAWWQFGSTLLHVTAVTAWLGGLAALGWLTLRQRLSAQRLQRLPRWSVYAGTAVTVLVITGVLQAIVQVRYPGALLTTTYGFVLLTKVLLVAVAAGLGLLGNRWIRRQIALTDGQPAPGQTARLRGRVRLEALTGAIVVVLSGVLSSITPAKADFAPQTSRHDTIGPYAVTIRIAPTRRGPESLRVTVLGRADATPPARSLLLDLSQVDGPVRTLRVDFPYRLPGVLRPRTPTPVTFSSASVNLPSTGTWTGTLTVVAGPTEQYTAPFDYQVH